MPNRRAHEARPPGEARRPPRRAYPRSGRSTQRVALGRRAPAGNARRRSTRRVRRRTPRRPSGRSPRPPRRVHPRSERCAQRVAPGRWGLGTNGSVLRQTRCVERSERGCVRLGGRRASPGFGASCGERIGMGYTLSHPMDAATRQPLGAARQARALRLQDRLASLASCGPQAPDSRGYALRASPAEHGRFAPAPRAAGARFTRFASRLWSMAASLPLHRPRAPRLRRGA